MLHLQSSKDPWNSPASLFVSSLHGNGVTTKEASCKLYRDSQGIEGSDGCREEVGGGGGGGGGDLAAMTRFPFFRILFLFLLLLFLLGGGGGGEGTNI